MGNKKKGKQNKSKNEVQEFKTEEKEIGTTSTVNDDEINEEEISNKRQFEENDSGDEEKPKKKKKKKGQQPPEENKKGAKSIRQQKKEKHAERVAEAAAAAKDQHKSGSLSYLSQWKHDKQNWKFMKAKQAWLYKNKFSVHYIPNESWPILLEYFESAKGNIRNMLLEDANKIIKQMDEWTESQNKSTGRKGDDDEEAAADSDNELDKPDDTCYKRARDLIQCLQE